MKNTVKKIMNVVSTVLVALVVILAILLVGVRFIGFSPYTVLSGSMRPAYQVGSVIYVTKVDADELKVKDPLTYSIEGTVVTHRIIEIGNDDKGLYFITQGDANNDPDPKVYPEQIIGKPVFTIPLLGYLSNFIQNPPGTYIAIAFCAALIIICFLPDFLMPKTEEDKKAITDSEGEKPEEKAEEKAD